MSVFEIGAWTFDEALKGGADYDDGQAAPMEEEEEEEEEDLLGPQVDQPSADHQDSISWTLREYPAPTPILEFQPSGAYYRFPEKLLPQNLASIIPQIMLGFRGWKEMEEKEKRNIFSHYAMPMIVHGSPIVSIFSTKFVEVKGKPIPAQEKPWSRTFVSWGFAVFLLEQLRFACMAGLIPFHNSVTKTYLDKCNADYQEQLNQSANKQTFDLRMLFEKAKMLGWKNVRNEFIELMENYSMQHIWSIEFYLYSLLILPYGDSITLSQVLTPNARPSLSDVLEGKRKGTLQDVHDFFAYKAFLRAEQILDCTKKGVENPDKSPNSLVPDRFQYDLDHAPPSEIYRGYMPEKFLREYFTSLDSENILGLTK